MQKNSLFYSYYKYAAWLIFFMAIIGIVRSFSDIPWGDMWDGYLDFYVKVQDGQYAAWWAQHNEHRTFFSNIFFYLDLALFNGSSWFLLTLNFILLMGISFTFWKIISFTLHEQKHATLRNWLFFMTVILVFSWSQNENLTWGFQSQFIAAFLFPLLSFYLLGLSSIYVEYSKRYFTFAVLLGMLSVGTMANGIAALPVMLLLGLFLRIHWSRVLIILFAFLLMAVLFFYDYHSHSGHGEITKTLTEHTFDFFFYFFVYLGNLFKISVHTAAIAGIAFTLGSIWIFSKVYREPKRNVMYFVLLAFILYYAATAFASAGGRAIFGIEQAFQSRYMTPALIAWSSFLSLFVFMFADKLLTARKFFYFFALIPFIFFVDQLKVFAPQKDGYLYRKMGILALELGVRDEMHIKTVFPFVDWVIEMSIKPRERNLSTFSDPLIIDAKESIGTIFKNTPTTNIPGSVEIVSNIPTESNYLFLAGKFKSASTEQDALYFVNRDMKIIGYGLKGFENESFRGYVLREEIYSLAYIISKKSGKYMQIGIQN